MTGPNGYLRGIAQRAAAAPSEKEARRRRRNRADYSHMDPADLTEEGVPHPDYSSPSIEDHPFGGGTSAGDY
jgi:hypothetical protein